MSITQATATSRQWRKNRVTGNYVLKRFSALWEAPVIPHYRFTMILASVGVCRSPSAASPLPCCGVCRAGARGLAPSSGAWSPEAADATHGPEFLPHFVAVLGWTAYSSPIPQPRDSEQIILGPPLSHSAGRDSQLGSDCLVGAPLRGREHDTHP